MTKGKIPLHRSRRTRGTQDSFVSFLQILLGMTALFSATLFFVSWIYNRRYFEAFGLHGYAIRYSAQDYILNAKSVLSIALFVVALLVVLLPSQILANRRFRLLVSLVSIVGLILLLAYLIRDIWQSFSVWGLSVMAYRTSWPTLLAVLTLLVYSAAAPTILFEKATASYKYRRLSHLIAWSGPLALGILVILFASNFIGSIEGHLDASVNSRLLFVNVATEEPLGFGIQPDSIAWDDNQKSIYMYINLRFLTQYEGLLYVFQPEQGVLRPLVHVISIDKATVLSLGPNASGVEPVFAPQATFTPTPSQP